MHRPPADVGRVELWEYGLDLGDAHPNDIRPWSLQGPDDLVACIGYEPQLKARAATLTEQGGIVTCDALPDCRN